jgi:MFS transporter, DHA1 family, inner membrane transport protein
MGLLGPLLLQLADEYHSSLAQVGLLASATALPQAFGSPILGPLSDRFGRREVLAASLAGLGLATCAGALASSYVALLLIRVVCGILASAGPTSSLAAVGDHIPADRRASAYGWVNAGFGFAALVGVPLIGLIGGAFGWRWSFLALGGATLLLAGVIWLRLPRRAGSSHSPAQMLRAYRRVLSSPGLGALLSANLFERQVYASFGLFLPAYLMQSYGIDLVGVAPLLGVTAIGALLGNVLGGRLADRASRPLIFALGQAGSAVFALGFFVLAPGLALSVGLATLFFLITSTSRPAIITLASTVSAEHRGTAIGIFSFTNQLGWAIGPALTGLGLSQRGYPAVGLLCGLAALVAALRILSLWRRPASATAL